LQSRDHPPRSALVGDDHLTVRPPGVRAVDDAATAEQSGSSDPTGGNLRAPLTNEVHRAAHVADAGDAQPDEERKESPLGVRKDVQVHVPQAGQHITTDAIDTSLIV